MANFVQAMEVLKRDEGRYVNNPADPGGETYMGIARTRQPQWDGWLIVDKLRSSSTFPGILDADPDIQASVNRFYSKTYWRFDGVLDQSVANKLFDEAVNMQGSGDSGVVIKLVQQAVRYVSGRTINVDGQWGPQTEALVNSVDPASLLLELRAQIAVYYCKLGKPEFLLGWMRRAVE